MAVFLAVPADVGEFWSSCDRQGGTFSLNLLTLLSVTKQPEACDPKPRQEEEQDGEGWPVLGEREEDGQGGFCVFFFGYSRQFSGAWLRLQSPLSEFTLWEFRLRDWWFTAAFRELTLKGGKWDLLYCRSLCPRPLRLILCHGSS